MQHLQKTGGWGVLLLTSQRTGVSRWDFALGSEARRYSRRRAFIGEIEAARFAGIMAAKNEQMASAPPATVRASGSHDETPYSWAEINRPAPIARGNPRISPINTRLNAPLSTS